MSAKPGDDAAAGQTAARIKAGMQSDTFTSGMVLPLPLTLILSAGLPLGRF